MTHLYATVRHGVSMFANVDKLRTSDNGKTWFVRRTCSIYIDGRSLESITEEVNEFIKTNDAIDVTLSNKIEYDYYGKYPEVECEIVGWAPAPDDLVARIDLGNLAHSL